MTSLSRKALGAVALLALAVGGVWSCVNHDVKLHHVYIVSDTEKIAPGDAVKLHLMAYPMDANTGFPHDSIRWRSSDTTVAQISALGTLTALRYGQTTIYADYGPMRAEKTLRVSEVIELPSADLMAFLLDRFDTNHDGKLEGYETSTYTGLDLSELVKRVGARSVDLTGIECFNNLQTLRAEGISIRNVNLSRMTLLKSVQIERCSVDTIDLRGNPDIEDVRLNGCGKLRALLFGSYKEYGRNKLKVLQLRNCDLHELDLTRCGETLGNLECCHNPNLDKLDLSVDTCLFNVQYSVFTDITWPDVPPEYLNKEECK